MRVFVRVARCIGLIFLVGLSLVAVASAQRPHFNPADDYAYDLAATEAAVVNVDLTAKGFDCPQPFVTGDTIFLEIFLEKARTTAPSVIATSGERTARQVFEKSAHGRRFLDLSSLGVAAGARVILRGDGVEWKKGPARVFVYRNASLASRRVLVLAPHPDDAEIGAFGVYRHTEADVITVTAGDAGGENFTALFPAKGEHFRVKGWIRTWDSITVPFYGGIVPGRARNLGYYDGTLQALRTNPSQAAAPVLAELNDPAYYRRLNVDPALRDRAFAGSWNGLVADLAWELARVKPTVIVAPHPLLDAHPDHQYVTIALIEALAKWDGPCELYLYTNHNWENEAFPLGDRESMTGLPSWSGPELFFRRIYSHPLTVEDRKLKLVALEDMHDLRAFDLRDGSPPVDEATRRSWKDHDYYRRGPRPNELFFVLSREDAVKLHEAFLKTRR